MSLSIEDVKQALGLEILPELLIILRNKLEIYVWCICENKNNYPDMLEVYFYSIVHFLMGRDRQIWKNNVQTMEFCLGLVKNKKWPVCYAYADSMNDAF